MMAGIQKNIYVYDHLVLKHYCSAGRIPGAEKMGTVWLIPKNATKPLDGRRKSAGQSKGEHHD